jgi:hypothetical protein
LTLPGETTPARVSVRNGLPDVAHDVRRCQVPSCQALARRRIEIELPAAWEASATYTVLTVAVGACFEHAPELERRAAAMLEARADLYNPLTIVEGAVRIEADLRSQLDLLVAGGERS